MAGAAGVLLVARRTGRALFLRRPSGIWDLPGGRAERGEDPVTTAMRELTEETGFTGDVVVAKPRYRVSWCHGDLLFGHIWPECPDRYTGIVAYTGGEIRPVLDREHTAFVWKKPSDPPTRIISGLDWMLAWSLRMDLCR